MKTTGEGLKRSEMALAEAPCFAALVSRFPEADNLPPDPKTVANFLRSKLRPTRREILPHITQVDNRELMVPLAPVRLAGTNGALIAAQNNMSMYSVTGGGVFVRESLAEKLHEAAICLQENAPVTRRRQLLVTYGYRPKSVQMESNERIKTQIIAEGFKGSEEELLDRMHILSAQVEVSGHPTGGAADTGMLDWHGERIDLGIDPSDDATELFYWPFISKEQGEARHELRTALETAGLHFYDGESGHVDSPGTPEGAFHEQQRLAKVSVSGSAGPLVLAHYMQIEFKSPVDIALIQ